MGCWFRIAASKADTAWQGSRAEISVAEIIAALEGPIALTECSTDVSGLCDLEPCCPIKNNQRIISQAVRGALEKVMLSDLVQPAASDHDPGCARQPGADD